MAARRVGQLVGLLVVLVFSESSAAQAPQMNRRVLFLTGCWEWVTSDRVVDEHWMAPRGSTMLGVSRTVRASGELLSYEVVILRQSEDGINYEAHPSGQESAVFRSVPGLTDSRVVFENPAHDFPQRIGYELKGPDSLLAWIEGSRNGKAQRVEFPYRRVSCSDLNDQTTTALPIPTPNAARDLRGAIDIHIHASPDENARSVDAIDAARQAARHGMRAIVLKNHWDPTAGLAMLARKEAPGVEVFGGVDMNLAVGGMNPQAVEHMAKLGTGRFVWMPTFDAEAQLKANKSSAPFVPVAKGAELLPETRAVIAAAAKHGFVLASGNISAEEALMVFREGKRAGVQHMVATHGTASPTLFTVAQAREAAQLGAFIEFCAGNLAGAAAQAKIDQFTEQIRSIGPAAVVLSTDLGTKGLSLPADGFAVFLEMLRRKGFSDQELDLMAKQNPAKLLGLP